MHYSNKVLPLFSALLVLSLSACDGGKPSDKSGAQDEGVFDPMVGTMDRAKGVEDLTNQRDDRLREAEQASQ